MRKGFTLIELLIVVFVLAIFVGMAGGLTGCDESNKADKAMRKQTEAFMQEANRKVGMPAMRNFQERKLAKMIFELRDQEKLICYAYIVNRMTGRPIFLGKCIGFGIPYSVQYTNPQKVARWTSGGGYAVLPQADPNGLFMPSGLSATWLMMIDPKTKAPRPVYVEPEILVSPFPLHDIDAEKSP